jgi:hypothetical protein
MMWCGIGVFACCIVTSAVICFTYDTDVLVLTVVVLAHHHRTEIILSILAIELVAYLRASITTIVTMTVTLSAMTCSVHTIM